MTPLGNVRPVALSAVELRSLDGASTALQQYLGTGLTLVQLVRYYGCLPCQQTLVSYHDHRRAFEERGVEVVVVGVAATFQARNLRDRHGITFPLLLDPEQRLYRALELRRLRWIDLLRPRTWSRYLPVFVRRYVTRRLDGPAQGRIVGDLLQLPGLALLDADGALLWVHRGAVLGDYPPLDEVLRRIDDLRSAHGSPQ